MNHIAAWNLRGTNRPRRGCESFRCLVQSELDHFALAHTILPMANTMKTEKAPPTDPTDRPTHRPSYCHLRPSTKTTGGRRWGSRSSFTGASSAAAVSPSRCSSSSSSRAASSAAAWAAVPPRRSTPARPAAVLAAMDGSGSAGDGDGAASAAADGAAGAAASVGGDRDRCGDLNCRFAALARMGNRDHGDCVPAGAIARWGGRRRPRIPCGCPWSPSVSHGARERTVEEKDGHVFRQNAVSRDAEPKLQASMWIDIDFICGFMLQGAVKFSDPHTDTCKSEYRSKLWKSSSMNMLLLVGLAAAAQVPSTARSVQYNTYTYRGSSASIVNPERGFRAELADFPAMAHLDVCARFNLTLAQAYCYLTEFCSVSPCKPLSKAFLDDMGGGFARARQAGVKLVLRFAYELIGASDGWTIDLLGDIWAHAPAAAHYS